MTKSIERFFEHKHKLIIAGPCSFGSGTDSATAEAICEYTDLYRSSLWKPRTLPGGFEGVGKAGVIDLELLAAPKALTEVFDEDSVKACYGHIRHLWIGSRTSCDPFAMRELAETLKEYHHEFETIGIKNPPCKDVALWVGAIKRIYMVAPGKVYAIFRGVKTLDSTYRNYPDFSFLVEVIAKLKEEEIDIPVVLDSSHICGNADMIEDFTKQAFTIYPFDGVMIECSTEPDKVKSDAKQHIKPEVLERIVDWILYSAPSVPTKNAQPSQVIMRAREDIKAMDIKMFNILADYLFTRNMRVKEIAKEKHKDNSCIFVPARYEELKAEYQSRFNGIIPKEMIDVVFETIHNLSILEQAKLIHTIDEK